MKFMGITSTETPGFGFAFILGTVIGGFTLLVGIGLLARVEIARGIANFLAGLNLLFGLLGLAGSLIGSVVAGPLGLLLSLKGVLDIATRAFMIFLIGESEKRAPNFSRRGDAVEGVERRKTASRGQNGYSKGVIRLVAGRLGVEKGTRGRREPQS